MDADDIINAYEANKREIEELREEKKQIEALQNRLIEIDEQWDKELKKLAKTNNQLQRLGKAWQKTHQPPRRKRCEDSIQQKKDEIEQTKQKIRGLAKERTDILSKVQYQKLP